MFEWLTDLAGSELGTALEKVAISAGATAASVAVADALRSGPQISQGQTQQAAKPLQVQQANPQTVQPAASNWQTPVTIGLGVLFIYLLVND